jgi:hypothetical protein
MARMLSVTEPVGLVVDDPNLIQIEAAGLLCGMDKAVTRRKQRVRSLATMDPMGKGNAKPLPLNQPCRRNFPYGLWSVSTSRLRYEFNFDNIFTEATKVKI